MDSMVEISPPLSVKFKLSEHWFDQMINDYLPFEINQDRVKVNLLAPLDIKFTPKGLVTEINLDLEYPFKLLGAVRGKAKMKLAFSNLADIDLIEVRLISLDWLEGPRVQINRFIGFSIGQILSDQIEKAKAKVEEILTREIPPAFKAFTESNPLYGQYLIQELPDVSLKVKTNIKSLFYQFVPGNKWLDLQLFPELEVNIADQDNLFVGTPGPFKPGVGGGLVDFQLELSTAYINEIILPKVQGQEIKAGSKKVVIENVVLGIGTEGFMANVSFRDNDPPAVNGLLVPILDINNQMVTFDIKHLEMQEGSWFWRGLLSLLKSSIENRIEESLKINVQQIVKNNIGKIQQQLETALEAQKLQLNVFQPAFAITEILPAAKGLTLNGTIGGKLEIWSKQLEESNGTLTPSDIA